MKRDNKRPSVWHPIARAKFDAMMTSYKEVQARVLPTSEAERFDIDLPPSWKDQPVSWLKTSLGIGKKLPPGSGAGYIQSPFELS